MSRRDDGVFARRGIILPGFKATALTVLFAFVIGVLMGWFTSEIPGLVRAMNNPEPLWSPETISTPEPAVSVPPLSIITRNFSEEDREAGLTSLEYPYEGEGTFTVVPGDTNPLRANTPIRYISVEVEDGLNVSGRDFANFVMTALNDPRGWGANNRLQYVRTEGVADYRVVIGSPYTVAKMCADPHAVAPDALGAELDEISPSPSASPGAEASPLATPEASVGPTPEPSVSPGMGVPTDATCAERGIIAISVYDWAAGLEAYEDQYHQARVYLLLHTMGHLRGLAEQECTSGRAEVMVNQRTMPQECEANPWPFPDIELTVDNDE